jgi:hypothetical protein
MTQAPNKQGNMTRTMTRRRRELAQKRNGNGNGNGNGTANLLGIFSDDTKTLAQAITNPFADSALGAVIPDQWTPPTIPAMDRITFNLNPAQLSLFDNTLVINGFIIILMPRCLATGWLAEVENDQDPDVAPSYQPLVDLYPINDIFGFADTEPLAEMYSLFLGILGTNGTHPSPTILAFDPEMITFTRGMNILPFSRHTALAESCSGARMVGGGLKIFSDEAPIETGGTVYGGWITPADVYQSLAAQGIGLVPKPEKMVPNRHPIPVLNRSLPQDEWNNVISVPRPIMRPRRHKKLRRRFRLRDVNAFTASNIQDALKYRHTFRGRDGITVRYSPLQSSVQEEFRTVYEDALFNENTTSGRLTNVGVSIGTNDLIGANDYVPCAVWNYNKPSDTESETYSLRIEMRVHLQAEPDGDCPFMTHTVTPDPNYESLRLILENKDVYPVTTRGQSFASFLKGFDRAVKSLGGAFKMVKSLQ